MSNLTDDQRDQIDNLIHETIIGGLLEDLGLDGPQQALEAFQYLMFQLSKEQDYVVSWFTPIDEDKG